MIKTSLKVALSQPIWGYLRYYKFKILHNGYFAIDDLDKKLLKYLDYENGYFIELGANDGFTQSNTIAFENKKGWRGVLIEPNPHLYLSCCHFRGKQGNSIHCCACVPFDYDQKYVDIEYANLMSTSASLTSDIEDIDEFKERGASRLHKSAKNIQFGAQARTLTNVLESSGSPAQIDFMSLDVEGAELAVLSGLDFNRYSIKYILVECRDVDRLQDFLADFGYSILEKLSHHDYLFAKS